MACACSPAQVHAKEAARAERGEAIACLHRRMLPQAHAQRCACFPSTHPTPTLTGPDGPCTSPQGVFIGKPVMRSQRKPDHILGLAHVGALNLVLPGTVGRPWPAGAAQAVADEVQPQLVVPSPVQQVMTRSATAAAATRE